MNLNIFSKLRKRHGDEDEEEDGDEREEESLCTY